ncbi:hypothetical protein FOA52_000592 [Chlamydomonas sp. UWO 241]|nr:hypothetical protein FOA52_000592 [Chlamydomonas sp. UWO 241]
MSFLRALSRELLSPTESSYGGSSESTAIDVCSLGNVSYEHRVDNPDAYNFCLVPNGGVDAVFFAAMGILVMCLVVPRWDALMTLIVGAVYEAFAYTYNLGHFSNASALWLGMRPADIFVYAFLPPFLLDAAVRINWYVLKRTLIGVLFIAFVMAISAGTPFIPIDTRSIIGVLFMAFVMVISACILFIPFMLDALGLKASGWTAIDAALFGATIASTDAAAVASCLHAGGAPEIISVILEGESIFNDASSLTLFEIFQGLILEGSSEPLTTTVADVVVKTIWSLFAGSAIGLAMGIFNQLVFLWLQHRNVRPAIEVSFSVGGCYMAFYITQVWCKGSGCIGAVVYGLYGNATLLWGMSKKARSSLMFAQFWEVFAFIINALIFFYVGAAVVNFVVRSGADLYTHGVAELLRVTMYRLPLIYLFSFAMRFVFLYIGFMLFKYTKLTGPLSWQQIVFITVGGLRGSLSLVLAAAIAGTAAQAGNFDATAQRVLAEMAIFIAGYVILTLIVNAPLCGPLMTLLKLDHLSPQALSMRAHVKHLYEHFSKKCLHEMQAEQDEDEMLQGVDWDVVEEQLDVKPSLDKHLPEINPFIDWMAWWKALKRIPVFVKHLCNPGQSARDREEELARKRVRSGSKARESRVRADLAAITKLDKESAGKPGREPSTVPVPMKGVSVFGGVAGDDASGAVDGLPRAASVQSPRGILVLGERSLPDLPPAPSGASMLGGVGSKSGHTSRSSGLAVKAETVMKAWLPNTWAKKPSKPSNTRKLQATRLYRTSSALVGSTSSSGPPALAKRSGLLSVAPSLPVPAKEDPSQDSQDGGSGETAPPDDKEGDDNVSLPPPPPPAPPAPASLPVELALTRPPPPPPAPPTPPAPAPRPACPRRRPVPPASAPPPPVALPPGDDAPPLRAQASPDMEASGSGDSRPQAKAQANTGRLVIKAADGQATAQSMSDTAGMRLVQRASKNTNSNYLEAIPTNVAGPRAARGGDNAIGRGSVPVMPSYGAPPGGGAGSPRTFVFESPEGHEFDGIGGGGGAGGGLSGFSDAPLGRGSAAIGGGASGGDRQLGRGSVALAGSAGGDRPLGRGSTAIGGDRSLGHGSVGINKAGVSKMSRPNAAMAALAAAVPGGQADQPLGRSSMPVGPSSFAAPRIGEGFVFELPEGHEWNQMGGGGPLAARSAALPRYGRPASQRSQSPGGFMFESPEGHELDGNSGAGGAAPGADRPLGRGSVGIAQGGARGVQQQQQQQQRQQQSYMGMPVLDHSQAKAERPLGRISQQNTPYGAPGGARAGRSASVREAGPMGGSLAGGAAGSSMLDEESGGDSLFTTSAGIDGTHKPGGKTGGIGRRRGGGAADQPSLEARSVPIKVGNPNLATVARGHGTIDEDEAMDFGDESQRGNMEAQHDEHATLGKIDMAPEYRLRLLTGLKQYYKQKYEQGVLQATPYKVLTFICDEALEAPELPMRLWERCAHEINGGVLSRAELRAYYRIKSCRQGAKAYYNLCVRGICSGALAGPEAVLSWHLNQRTLVALEASVELWISLTDSLQTQWLEYSGAAGEIVLKEVSETADGAWQFIVERRIEVPETFQAIQTYRATVTLLSQAITFVKEMTDGGMIDEKTSHTMLHTVEQRMHAVSKRGAQWRRQTVTEILANTPFLRGLSPRLIQWVRTNSAIRVWTQGETIWSVRDEDASASSSKADSPGVPGVFVVLSGVVKVTLRLGEALVPLYLGSGGVAGLIATTLQDASAGMALEAVVAEGHTFGKGPVVLHMPKELFAAVRRFARSDQLATFQELELAILRTSATHVLDMLRHQVTSQIGSFVRGAMQEVVCGLDGHKASSPLAARQRLRSLLFEGGTEEESIINWVSELMAMKPAEAHYLLELGEDVLDTDGGVGNDATNPSLWREAMFKAIGNATTEVYGVLRSAIKESVAVILPPGEVIYQFSTMVLIQGTLSDIGKPCDQPTSAATAAARRAALLLPSQAVQAAHPVISGNDDHVAPSVMVWTPDYFGSEVAHQEPVLIRAGPTGATLMVYGTDANVFLQRVESDRAMMGAKPSI